MEVFYGLGIQFPGGGLYGGVSYKGFTPCRSMHIPFCPNLYPFEFHIPTMKITITTTTIIIIIIIIIIITKNNNSNDNNNNGN